MFGLKRVFCVNLDTLTWGNKLLVYISLLSKIFTNYILFHIVVIANNLVTIKWGLKYSFFNNLHFVLSVCLSVCYLSNRSYVCLHLPLYLNHPACMFVSLSVCLSMSVSLSAYGLCCIICLVFVYFCLSVCQSVCLNMGIICLLFVCLSVCQYVSLSRCQYVSQSVTMSICLSVSLYWYIDYPIYLSDIFCLVCLSVHMSFSPSVLLSVCLSDMCICLTVCLAHVHKYLCMWFCSS